MNSFADWFNTFLEEKDLPFMIWEIEDAEGNIHIIDSDFVVETILQATTAEEQEKIKNIIVQIDFRNGDINHFFHHLAVGIVNNYGESVNA